MELVLPLITILLGFTFSARCSDVYSRNDFPEGFVFGSAVSAFQWEGAVDEDGRTPSIWDTFAHSSNGPSGDIACDGYHKYKEDVRLMYDMGLDAFRFSISWPRLIPSGRGPVNPKGLRFYKSFIDELTRHGIEPHVTLFHNDLPQVLEDEYGGWIDRRIIDDVTAFADVCFREFGNAVKFWSTINEPNMLAMGGYDLGAFPPMHCSPPFGLANCSSGNSSTEPYIALHNMLLAHASTARLYKQKYKDKQNGFVGITCFAYWMVPLTSSEEDKIATQRAKDFLLGWVLHPLVFGDYPDVMKRIAGKRLPTFSEEESDLVKDSFGFLGVIHYTALYSAYLPSSRQGDYVSDMNVALISFGNSTLVEFDVLPWGLEGVLEYIKKDYVNPKGLQFYKNLIQELVNHGIEPHVTLFHYDLPQCLEDEYGGWLNPKIIEDFTAYADVCFREFGNHVKFWTTINEANIFVIGSYNDGDLPPGRCSSCFSGNSSTEPYIVAHNLLLAHASASRLYKQKYKSQQPPWSIPYTNSKDDVTATQRGKDFIIGWMLGPLILGDYPEEMKRIVGPRLPDFSEEEIEQVKGSSDFVGVIHYQTVYVRKSKPSISGKPDFHSDMGVEIITYGNNPTQVKYDVLPWALEGVLDYIKQTYDNPPIYILENGTPLKQDQLQDKERVEYIHAYIGAVLNAIRNGSDTRGYFVWSLVDLYELLSGYDSSFGLYYVNFSDPQLTRSPKLSAQWYSAFLKGNSTFLGSQGITQLQSNHVSSSSSY